MADVDDEVFEQRLRYNAPRLAVRLLAIGAVCEACARLIAFLTSRVAGEIAVVLIRGARDWCILTAAWCGLLWGLSVLAAAMNQRFPRASGRAGRIVLVVLLVAVVLYGFFKLPFCLGSLPAGTYDCIPLAKRVVSEFAR